MWTRPADRAPSYGTRGQGLDKRCALAHPLPTLGAFAPTSSPLLQQQFMRTATATAPAGPPIAPSSQAIRLRNRAGNSWGDLTRESEKQHPGPDGIRARLASSPKRPRMGPARAQALGMPVRPVLPSTALFPRNCRRAHSRPDSRPSSGRVWSWFGARTGHAAMSTGCPRARAPQSPKRRWAGGGHRGLTTGPPSRTLPHLPCLRSPVSWPAYAG